MLTTLVQSVDLETTVRADPSGVSRGGDDRICREIRDRAAEYSFSRCFTAAGAYDAAMRAEAGGEGGGALPEQVAKFYAASPDGRGLMAAFREALLLVPLGEGTTLLTGDYGGLRWLYSFSSRMELARYAAARGRADVECRFITVRGARVCDEFLPGLPQPCGVVLDVAGERPMTFPPMRGVVSDSIALDATDPGIEES
jgi:hypothetical protein